MHVTYCALLLPVLVVLGSAWRGAAGACPARVICRVLHSALIRSCRWFQCRVRWPDVASRRRCLRRTCCAVCVVIRDWAGLGDISRSGARWPRCRVPHVRWTGRPWAAVMSRLSCRGGCAGRAWATVDVTSAAHGQWVTGRVLSCVEFWTGPGRAPPTIGCAVHTHGRRGESSCVALGLLARGRLNKSVVSSRVGHVSYHGFQMTRLQWDMQLLSRACCRSAVPQCGSVRTAVVPWPVRLRAPCCVYVAPQAVSGPHPRGVQMARDSSAVDTWGYDFSRVHHKCHVHHHHFTRSLTYLWG